MGSIKGMGVNYRLGALLPSRFTVLSFFATGKSNLCQDFFCAR